MKVQNDPSSLSNQFHTDLSNNLLHNSILQSDILQYVVQCMPCSWRLAPCISWKVGRHVSICKCWSALSAPSWRYASNCTSPHCTQPK